MQHNLYRLLSSQRTIFIQKSKILFYLKMVDLHGKDKGNISLPEKLQSWDDEKERSRPTIINTQVAFYEIRIADIENRIHRLEDRNEELLEEIEITDERSAAIDAETADEIANLNKQLTFQTDKVETLTNKIETLENNRIEDRKAFEEKVESFNQRYKKKKVELVSQIKVLTAKINGLEDFKKTQASLLEKLKSNEEQMKRNEEHTKEVLQRVNRKFEFDKEMLKNEMYTCLLDLAAKFQVETDGYISLPNKRLMRENILLKNELLQVSKQISSNDNARSIARNAVVDYRKKITERSSNTRHNIITSKVQNVLIKCLRDKYENTKEHFSSINIPDRAKESKYLILIENARREEKSVASHLARLNSFLHKERTRIAVAQYLYRKLNCKIKAAVETVYDLKYISKCMVQCPETFPDVAKLNCTELLLHLRNILYRGQTKMKCGIIKSIETIPSKLEFDAEKLEKISDKDFKIEESEEEEPSFKKLSVEVKRELDKKGETSIESSSLEELLEDISEDTVSDLKHDYKLSKEEDDYEEEEEEEYLEEESSLSTE